MDTHVSNPSKKPSYKVWIVFTYGLDFIILPTWVNLYNSIYHFKAKTGKNIKKINKLIKIKINK